MIKEKRLNLACGQNKIEGFFGVDIVKTEAADAVVDLQKYPWDIESESAEEIISSHYIEHIPHDSTVKHLVESLRDNDFYDDFKNDFLKKLNYVDEQLSHPYMPSEGMFKFMDEVYRILIPGGKIKIIAPYYSSMRSCQDPTHTRDICEATFMYFNKNFRNINRLDHYGVVCDFDFTYGYDIDTTWNNREDSVRAFAMKHYLNVINDIQVLMTKKVE